MSKRERGAAGDGRRVVVTGLGPITPVGEGVEGLWEGLQRAKSGVGPVTRFDAAPFRTRVAAEIPDFERTERLDRKEARRVDRYGALSLEASRLALEDARLDPSSVVGSRVAVQMGSALGGVAYAEEQHASYMERGVRGVDPMLALSVFGGASSCNVAIRWGFTGPNSTNSMSCASGAIAVGDAFRLVRSGRTDVAVAGGAEAPLAPLTFGAFAVLRAMSTRNDEPERASRPFDRDRDGFVMGEAACLLVLEELGRAVRRDAPIYAEVVGYGTTNDAHHMTRPLPGGEQAARAMELALEDAGVGASAVDHVNAHGSATPLNDTTEARAIRSVLGERATRVPISATKGYYGHALGASGAVEAAICSLSLSRGWLPPTVNLENLDEEAADLTLVRGEGAEADPGYVMSNSFGFGGINAALLFRRWEG